MVKILRKEKTTGKEHVKHLLSVKDNVVAYSTSPGHYSLGSHLGSHQYLGGKFLWKVIAESG